MTRPIRVEYPGAIYHVMSRGVDGIPTYRDDLDRERYLDRLQKLVKQGSLIIHTFCLMTNHFHLLCETPVGKLSRWMQQLLSRYSDSFNCRYGRVGHLWQARYKAILVEEGSYFLDCSAYIHLNPVKAGLAQAPEDYPWSSYRAYLGLDSRCDWVSKDKTLSAFPDLLGYRMFVESNLGTEMSDPFEKAVGGIAFGSKEFVSRIRARIKSPARPAEMVGLRRLQQRNPMHVEEIRFVVKATCCGLSSCQKRRLFMYALRRFSHLTGRQIAILTGRSPQAVSAVWQGIEERRKKDSRLQSLVDALDRAALEMRSSVGPSDSEDWKCHAENWIRKT